MRKFIIIIFFATSIFFSCSDSTEPDSGQAIEDTKMAFLEMDNMLNMFVSDIMFSLLNSMPDITGIMESNSNLKKNTNSQTFKDTYAFRKLLKIQDDNPLLIFILLSQLHGTFTHADSSWSYSAEPDDALIFEYEFLDETDDTQIHAEIKLFNFATSTIELSMSIEIKIDGVLKEWTNLTIQGNDLLGVSQTPEITLIESDGGGKVDQISLTYDLSITNTALELIAGIDNQISVAILVQGEGFLQLDSDTTGNDLSNILRITITYGNMEIVIDNPMAEEGDIGDILHNGIKIGDLIVIDNELYVVFINGEEYPLSELMPTTFGIMEEM